MTVRMRVALNPLYANIFDTLLMLECEFFSLNYSVLFDDVLEKLQNA